MRNLTAMLASCALVGCAGLAALPVGAPSTIADRTVLDEKAAIGAEVTYTAAARLGTALARAGLIDREAFKRHDAAAYTALLAVRAAYKAGNANSYATSLLQLNVAAASIRDLTR